MSILAPALISRILEGYAMWPNGIHGVAHWARVLENGRRVAALTSGVDPDVIELFAVFHDARRVNDQRDDGHGKRGADLAKQLRGEYFDTDDTRFALLVYACQAHTSGRIQADPTVQVCWDADRLDLLRVGTRPSPRWLCTDAAKLQETMEWANDRAMRLVVPDLVRDEWRIEL
jgi:uncharacterized protein